MHDHKMFLLMVSASRWTSRLASPPCRIASLSCWSTAYECTRYPPTATKKRRTTAFQARWVEPILGGGHFVPTGRDLRSDHLGLTKEPRPVFSRALQAQHVFTSSTPNSNPICCFSALRLQQLLIVPFSRGRHAAGWHAVVVGRPLSSHGRDSSLKLQGNSKMAFGLSISFVIFPWRFLFFYQASPAALARQPVAPNWGGQNPRRKILHSFSGVLSQVSLEVRERWRSSSSCLRACFQCPSRGAVSVSTALKLPPMRVLLVLLPAGTHVLPPHPSIVCHLSCRMPPKEKDPPPPRPPPATGWI